MPCKVSVIVPVYNAEKTLAACLGNLVHQSLPEMELILVNDASTDGSLKILLDCERAFSDKVILVNLEHNSGPGGARNAGLAYASGTYIGFVDSDDIPDTHMYEKLYQTAVDGGYDMVDGAYYDEEKDLLILQTGDNCCGMLNGEKRSELVAGGGFLWSRIFHRDLLKGLSFRENIILEDLETLMLLFMRTQNLGRVRDIIYKHCASPGSASKVTAPIPYQNAILNAIEALASSILPLEQYSDIQDAVEYTIMHLYLCGVINVLHPDNKLEPSLQCAFLSELRKLRFQYVQQPYGQNKYAKQKFSDDDRQIIEQADAGEFYFNN